MPSILDAYVFNKATKFCQKRKVMPNMKFEAISSASESFQPPQISFLELTKSFKYI